MLTGYCAVKFGLNGPPSSTGDEPAYDSLGWELAHGRGFQFSHADPVWRAPYEEAAKVDPGLYSLEGSHVRRGPTTFRSPLFPLVVAGTDWLFGRQFWAIRLLNIACMALMSAVTVGLLHHLRGALPALAGEVLLLWDVRTRLYARTILSEPLTCALVALLILSLYQLAQTRRKRDAFVVGVLWGLGILARSNLALWLAGLLLAGGLWWLRARPARGQILGFAALMLLGAVLVCTPWGLRNCLLLSRWMPLGTHGSTQLSAAYSDSAWEHRGVWTAGDPPANPEPSDLTQLEWELQTADEQTAKARAWVQANPGRVPVLALLKILSEHLPGSLTEWFLLILTLGGLARLRNHPLGFIFATLLLANAIAVGLTWSVEGRFLVPLLPVFHVTSVVCVVDLLRPARPVPWPADQSAKKNPVT